MKNIPSFALALAFSLPLAVNAADTTSMKPGEMQQGASGHGGMGMGSGNAGTMGAGNMQGTGDMQSAGMSQGVIRKVDKSGKKITIKHGPLRNLDMPAMTMVFKVTDPAMLQQMRAGDKVDFVAERVSGVLTITKVEAAK